MSAHKNIQRTQVGESADLKIEGPEEWVSLVAAACFSVATWGTKDEAILRELRQVARARDLRGLGGMAQRKDVDRNLLVAFRGRLDALIAALDAEPA